MTFTKIVDFLKSLPKWLRYVVVILACGVAACFLLVQTTSCSSVRAVMHTDGTMNIKSTNRVLDSASFQINMFKPSNTQSNEQ